MKKIGKISSIMFTLASLANSSLATTADSTAKAGESGAGNIAPLIIGALLLCCVLFIGYKMDQTPEYEPAPKKMKPAKPPKKMKIEQNETPEITEQEESEIFGLENKNDIPYEKDENEYYEKDEIVDFSTLPEDDEYEEDDVSLFMLDENSKSSFENIDDDISFEESIKEKADYNDYNSTMVFDSNELNNEIRQSEPLNDYSDFEEQDELEYTDAVEGLDEKIDDLDTIEDYELLKQEEQSAESFMNELKKYEVAVDDNLGNFTTKKTSEKSTQKRYTKKKETEEVVEKAPEQDIEEMANLANSTQVDINFLEQMEQNMKKDQENRLKKSNKTSKEKKSTTKKTTTSKKTTKKKEE